MGKIKQTGLNNREKPESYKDAPAARRKKGRSNKIFESDVVN
jgi:hypothetical protein